MQHHFQGGTPRRTSCTLASCTQLLLAMPPPSTALWPCSGPTLTLYLCRVGPLHVTQLGAVPTPLYKGTSAPRPTIRPTIRPLSPPLPLPRVFCTPPLPPQRERYRDRARAGLWHARRDNAGAARVPDQGPGPPGRVRGPRAHPLRLPHRHALAAAVMRRGVTAGLRRRGPEARRVGSRERLESGDGWVAGRGWAHPARVLVANMMQVCQPTWHLHCRHAWGMASLHPRATELLWREGRSFDNFRCFLDMLRHKNPWLDPWWSTSSGRPGFSFFALCTDKAPVLGLTPRPAHSLELAWRSNSTAALFSELAATVRVVNVACCPAAH